MDNKQFEKKLELCLQKLNRETDLDWSEIVELLELDCSSDHLRKTAYGIKECYDYFNSKTKEMIAKEEYEKLLDQELKIKKEKIKLNDMKTQLNKQVRELARKEDLVEILENKLEELKYTKPLEINHFPITETSGRDGVMLCSDIHLGSEVDNILDKYNPNICKEKMNYYVDKVIQYGKQNNIDKLYVLMAGDLVSGIIHDVNRYESRLNIIEQIIMVSELIAETINKLSNYFYCICGIVLGNHDRIVAKKDKSIENENFAILIEQFVRLRLKDNPRVVFLEKRDEGILEIDIKGNKCICVHGHNDKDATLDRLIEMFEYNPNYIFKGHDHRAKIFEKNRTTVICNGAFSGEEYAKNARLYNKSIQIFSIFNEEGMEANYFINLGNYKK